MEAVTTPPIPPPTTLEDALTLFSRYGGVFNDPAQLRLAPPTIAQLNAACERCRMSGIPPAAVDAARAFVASAFEDYEKRGDNPPATADC